MNETCRLRRGERYGACDDDMKRAADHTVSANPLPVHFRDLLHVYRSPDRLKYIHTHPSNTKKSGADCALCVCYEKIRKKQANGMTVPFQKT